MFVQVNTFKAIKEYFVEGLEGLFEPGEIQTLFEITTEHFLGWSRTEQRTKSDARLSESELLDFHFTLKRLKRKEPIQYILEEAPFYGLLFKVTPDVLIPRPETEELVHLILNQNQDKLKILDIGTGSGCIPIAIKSKRSDWEVYAVDISEKALAIAGENAKKNAAECHFTKLDILEESNLPDTFPAQFDIIVSNPPYIRDSEKKSMDAGVTHFEPHLALFVEDDNPLIFYQAIGQNCLSWLKDGGKLYLEVNQLLARETADLLYKIGYKEVQVIKDINSNDRIVNAKK